MFETIKHKTLLRGLFSDCFEPLRSDLGNVHPQMRQSPFISGALLGICRAYANHHNIDEKRFDLIMDTVFEEVFRSESLTMQERAQHWLNEQQEQFMEAYYHGRQPYQHALDISWLDQYLKANFKKAKTLNHPL